MAKKLMLILVFSLPALAYSISFSGAYYSDKVSVTGNSFTAIIPTPELPMIQPMQSTNTIGVITPPNTEAPIIITPQVQQPQFNTITEQIPEVNIKDAVPESTTEKQQPVTDLETSKDSSDASAPFSSEPMVQ